ncbi:hypothetical protein LVB77_12160 [Lysobacter sp. 5GHs7-4]|uniref:hypothetical protein n=1 Tax=Lysobacter sp. 5GHs7-4 TaxID=2904253 RepID=UPI001E4F47F6|nr:hypothetical protein [Lysobacter sp. 5GHs7-4]UHQ21437.1 hypothetical protein LVB77_12160 [Lysobacter sp. 5GHs7-4]
MTKPVRRPPSPVARAIEKVARLQPLELLARYLAAGSMAAFDAALADSPELYEEIKLAADYGSDRIDDQEILYFHRQRKYRQRRYEFAFKFYACGDAIRYDAIEVSWCEIPLQQLLQRCSEMNDPGLRDYAVYLYDDEYLNLGTVLFANGRSLDFAASANGEEFIVVMLYGKSEEDERRAAAVRSRMVTLGATKQTHPRVERLADYVVRSRTR